jgi:hypothetical protein
VTQPYDITSWVRGRKAPRKRTIMPKNPRQTGKKAAQAASKVMRDRRFSSTARSAAASALAQAPVRKRRGK